MINKMNGKIVFVYTQFDFEDLDVYVVGVYEHEQDAINRLNEDIKRYAKDNEMDYDSSEDSCGVLFSKAAKEQYKFYIKNKLIWEIHVEMIV